MCVCVWQLKSIFPWSDKTKSHQSWESQFWVKFHAIHNVSPNLSWSLTSYSTNHKVKGLKINPSKCWPLIRFCGYIYLVSTRFHVQFSRTNYSCFVLLYLAHTNMDNWFLVFFTKVKSIASSWQVIDIMEFCPYSNINTVRYECIHSLKIKIKTTGHLYTHTNTYTCVYICIISCARNLFSAVGLSYSLNVHVKIVIFSKPILHFQQIVFLRMWSPTNERIRKAGEIEHALNEREWVEKHRWTTNRIDK